ncbi:hypothetical protein D3C73_1618530 [compost metagenome]
MRLSALRNAAELTPINTKVEITRAEGTVDFPFFYECASCLKSFTDQSIHLFEIVMEMAFGLCGLRQDQRNIDDT